MTNPVSDLMEIDLSVENDGAGDQKIINYGKRQDLEESVLPEHFYGSVRYEMAETDAKSDSARISQIQDEEMYSLEDDAVPASDTASETLSAEEAKEMVIEIQYAAVLGTLSDLSLAKRQQLANWTYFEKATLNYFLAAEGVTRDVDFSKVV